MTLPDLPAFEAVRGERFSMRAGDAAVPLELAEVTSLGEAPEGMREPFSLEFHAPEDALHPQGIYALEHEALGLLELFLVPLGPEGGAMRYEAIFT